MHFNGKISRKPFRGLRPKTFSAVIVFIFLHFVPAFNQTIDDFSDGDLSLSPLWIGSTEHFLVNSQLQLQLNAAAAGTSWVSTEVTTLAEDEVVWEFWIKQSFAPSAANYARFYLSSDQADLTAPLNGYYLQFGEAGSGDAIELFRQSGTIRQSVLRGSAGVIAAAFAFRVRVTRSSDGLWQLYFDRSGGRDFVMDAAGNDTTYVASSFMGISCTYTVSNATDFFFDDIGVIRSTPADTKPPEVVSATPTSLQSLKVVFSEPLDALSAEDPESYAIAPAGRHPSTARLNGDERTVELWFDAPFPNGHPQELAISRIADLSGNTLATAVISLLFFEPMPYAYRDVRISEMLPDPSPTVALPEAEFVELYNRGENPVDLSEWTLSDGITQGVLAQFILLPGHYLILCAPSLSGQFSARGNVMPISSFPSLNNAGDMLLLKDPATRTVDSVRYDASWLTDDEKADGGWSLEIIDPQNVCDERINWAYSESPTGGTPGSVNSVHASRPDNTGPKLISAFPDGPKALTLVFNEKLDNATPAKGEFIISPALEVQSAMFSDASMTVLKTVLSQQIIPGQPYTLKAAKIFDCPGNPLQEDFSQVSFVLPEEAVPGDIIVNEILFNPRPGGVDFVEIYNRSAKTIEITNWSLQNFHASSGHHSSSISSQRKLLSPGSYSVLTEDAQILKGEYINAKEETFWSMNLPGFNDDYGSVVLIDAKGLMIDSMFYREEMHSPFIRDDEGVSLERISDDGLAGFENWRSASAQAGFATPGYRNSNSREDPNGHDDEVFIEPEAVQRWVSGNDFARIRYRFDQGGSMANVRVLDPVGRVVRAIAEGELLGTEGFFKWEGDREDGAPVRTGSYLVWFEIFDAHGRIKTFKKRVIIY